MSWPVSVEINRIYPFRWLNLLPVLSQGHTLHIIVQNIQMQNIYTYNKLWHLTRNRFKQRRAVGKFASIDALKYAKELLQVQMWQRRSCEQTCQDSVGGVPLHTMIVIMCL
jgi:hypothetical protein